MSVSTEQGIEPSEGLRRLATEIGRPAQSLLALDSLGATQLQDLAEAISAAETREQKELEAAYREALPTMIRSMLMRWLRRGAV